VTFVSARSEGTARRRGAGFRLAPRQVCAALVLLACGESDPPAAKQVVVDEEAAVQATMPIAVEIDSRLSPREAGELLYRELECRGCHEIAMVPGMIVRPLDGLGERHSVESIVSLLSAPPAPMPDYGLDEARRRMLAVYLLERWP